jgi:hypothetical protein
MNEFDGLLPARRPVPAGVGHGAAGALALAQARRQRRRVGMSVAVAGAVAAGGVAFGGPAGTRDGLDVDPTGPQRVVTSAPAVARPPARALPRPTVSASTLPPPVPSPSRVAEVLFPTPPSESPRPRTTNYTRIDSKVVTDRPTESCDGTMQGPGTRMLCWRHLGPTFADSGNPIDVVWEICAQVADAEMSYARGQEAKVTISGVGGSWEAVSRGGAAHTRTIEQGTCVRYIAHWNGRDNANRPLRPGSYRLYAFPTDEGVVETYTGSGVPFTIA